MFEKFWAAYPRRLGANPKHPACRLFEAAVKSGVDPELIIAGAKRCAELDANKIGTPYIPQAQVWLRQRRWEDYTTIEKAEIDRALMERTWAILLDKEKRTGQWPSKQIHRSDIPQEFIESWNGTSS